MPELPEVETIRRDLQPLVRGRRIVGVEIDGRTAPLLVGATTDTEMVRAALAGRTILRLNRRGKYLVFELDDGRSLVVHLRMTGRLLWRSDATPAEPFERARLQLDGGDSLRWCDVRKFGTWRVVDDWSAALRSTLGPEPIDSDFTPAVLRRAVAGRSAPIKAVLLDQRRVAGLGNIYVDEALFEARIRPDTPAGELSAAAIGRLHAATRSVLERGIMHRGASFRDYVDGNGEQGQQHMFVQVFRRTGKPCYRCGAIIERSIVGGRSTHSCPRCQKRPRARTPGSGSGSAVGSGR